ncbi:hypothetical protein HDU79_010757 [Rhizoclosmatium sp. JEL0117]|nr:hypothetical protein HDU79_010757 [Rhizoclosmatium sp. JEL0117]
MTKSTVTTAWRWKPRSQLLNRVHIWQPHSKPPTQIVNNTLTDYKEAASFHFLSQEQINSHPLLTDGTVSLIIKSKKDLLAWTPETKFLPKYKFTIVSASDHSIEFGELALRIGNDPWVFWNGHIGYGVREHSRGHHYATHASNLAIQFARAVHNLNTIYITCDPTNPASHKTLQGIGFDGQYMGTHDIPEQAPLYRTGMRNVIVYRYGPACELLEPPHE